MTLVETVVVALLATSPFGSIPFAVTSHGENAQIEVMTQPVTRIVVNKDMEVLTVDGIEQTCKENENGSRI